MSTSLEYHRQLIEECLAADEPALPDVANPVLSLDWMAAKFAQMEQAKPLIAKAKARKLVVCVIRRKVCIRLSDFGRLFESPHGADADDDSEALQEGFAE